MTLSVLSVASEAFPLVKTGGLADVVGALPDALAPHDVATTTLIPGYPAVGKAIKGAKDSVATYPRIVLAAIFASAGPFGRDEET